MLFILEPIGEIEWEEVDHMVIRAKDEKEARKLANDSFSYENKKIWEDPNKVLCEVIDPEGESEIISSSIKW
jgi:hypothetical protein